MVNGIPHGTPQGIAEFNVMRNIISNVPRNEFITQQDRVIIAYRNQNIKINTNFPIKW